MGNITRTVSITQAQITVVNRATKKLYGLRKDLYVEHSDARALSRAIIATLAPDELLVSIDDVTLTRYRATMLFEDFINNATLTEIRKEH